MDPLQTLGSTGLPLRFIGLPDDVRQVVAARLLKRLGTHCPKPRGLTLAEAQQLTEEDFIL